MRRLLMQERADWRAKAEQVGFTFHTAEGVPYWDERAAFAFSLAEIEDDIEGPSAELEAMALDFVGRAVGDEAILTSLAIPREFWGAIHESWQRGDRNLYGRFDFAFDGQGPAKLLEYNADTPTALFEASVVQWHWMEERFPALDQWNSIHEALIERWALIGASIGASANGARVHFACSPEDDDDLLTTAYLQDTASQAGLDTRFIRLLDIGCDGARFVDLDGGDVRTLFKLWPWDWLAREPFFADLARLGPAVVEPAWRIIPASKGILAILHELYPGHPLLLPASLVPGELQGTVIRKPMLGREGANMIITSAAGLTQTDGPYGTMAAIEQAFAPLPTFDGWHPVLGVWMVGGAPRGLGIREDRSLVTGRGASFVPHVIA